MLNFKTVSRVTESIFSVHCLAYLLFASVFTVFASVCKVGYQGGCVLRRNAKHAAALFLLVISGRSSALERQVL